MENVNLESLESQVRTFLNRCSEIKQRLLSEEERSQADFVALGQKSAIKI